MTRITEKKQGLDSLRALVDVGGTTRQPPPPPPATTFTPFHRRRDPSAVSDVDVSHVSRGAGQVGVSGHALCLAGTAVVLSLLQAGLQQRLDLLLTRPQAVLQMHGLR